MLLILAAVSLSAVFSDKGIFSRAEESGTKYNEAKAREVLETVLLADGQYEKNLNPEYNQDEFLDELIKNEIPGSRIQGDVAIIGGWAFELDRSVPKIGRPLGKADKLVFPTLNATVELASDKKNAIINITAKEEKKGINKIEIWLLGEKIQEYTYDNIKTEITVDPPYIATQNGKYTIKAYGDLMESKTVEVTGIVASVKFEPNGNEEWKKSHSTVVTIEETADKVETAKYVWTNSVTTPEDNQFTDTQILKSGDNIIGGNDTMTGTYYLWTMLETQSGEILKWRSEGFNLDNQGPTVTLTPTPVSYSSFKLNLTAQDNESGIDTYEIFVKGVSQGETTVDQKSITKELTITNATHGETSCYVIVTDQLGHTTRQDITAKTLIDSKKPTVTLTSTAVSYSSFKLNLTAQDNESGIAMYEIFVKGKSQGKTTVDGKSATKELTITNATYGETSCYVIVIDTVGNTTRQDITAKTLMDTTVPKISSFIATPNSATAITLSATAQDTGTGVVKFEFSVGSTTKTVTCSATTSSVTKSVTITGLDTGSNKTCKVVVYDAKDNNTSKTTTGSTKLYTWERWSVITTTTYGAEIGSYLENVQRNPHSSACRVCLAGVYNSTGDIYVVGENKESWGNYSCLINKYVLNERKFQYWCLEHVASGRSTLLYGVQWFSGKNWRN